MSEERNDVSGADFWLYNAICKAEFQSIKNKLDATATKEDMKGLKEWLERLNKKLFIGNGEKALDVRMTEVENSITLVADKVAAVKSRSYERTKRILDILAAILIFVAANALWGWISGIGNAS